MPGWAALAGTARVEWAEGPPSGLPLGTSEPFLRPDSLPLLGEERVVRIRGPFFTDGRVPFRALFAPALAALNGLDEHPELIRKCGMTACTPLTVLAQGNGCAWLRVRVEEVTKLVEAAPMVDRPPMDRSSLLALPAATEAEFHTGVTVLAELIHKLKVPGKNPSHPLGRLEQHLAARLPAIDQDVVREAVHTLDRQRLAGWARQPLVS
ncbi:hypothetical protein ABZW30_46075 [Kitasatospora sp. NPDC004669]|uniref:hypothetical protein n=1 Tax=Kitasatospora sp. NPDC004669 TaxID=3154555 RepID=UPI0033BCB067